MDHLMRKSFLLAFMYTVLALSKENDPSLEVEQLPNDLQQRQNASALSSAIWLTAPTPPNNNNHHRSSNTQEGGSRKRKHEGHDSDSSDEVTLCWPNEALRECKEVSISWGLYAILKEHHVADLKECFCVTEGFDTFESEISMPLYVDGAVFDTLHYVAKYSGGPLPQLDITFLPESEEEDNLGVVGDSMENVCWPNPLFGECKEAEISHEDLYELLEGVSGDGLDLDSCSCASEGFGVKKKNPGGEKRGHNTGAVQTFVQSPRVTLCYFEGKANKDALWWEPEDGVKVQKTETCKQVTISSIHYKNSKRSQKKQVFNNGGVYECKGGCAELGYSVLMESKQQITLYRPKRIDIIGTRDRRDNQLGEWVYTYHTDVFDSRVTLCFFDWKKLMGINGIHDNSEVQWSKTNDGGLVRKLQVCNQLTMSRYLYISTAKAPGRKQRFNEYGLYECGGVGGCPGLGYGVIQGTRQVRHLNIRPVKPVGGGEDEQSAGEYTGTTWNKLKHQGRAGKPYAFQLVDRNRKSDTSELVYLYTSSTNVGSQK